MRTRDHLRGLGRSPEETPHATRPRASRPLALEVGNQALLRLLAPTRPPIQADGAWRGRGRDDERFEREAHRASDRIAAGERLEPGALTPTAGAAAGLDGVHPAIASTIEGARGTGSRLPRHLRRSLSASLGADLSEVRVHTDERAHGLSERLNARAFTSGRDVFFRRGAFDPDSRRGRDVLHHELTHVVQQSGRRPGGELGRATKPTIQRFIMQIGVDDEYTTVMSNKLKRDHTGEGYLQFKATWDPDGIRGSSYGEYDPQSTKFRGFGSGKGFERSTSRKLKGVPATEPLRIVAHGNIYGMVGGYSPDRMFALLSRLGLPKSHTGGIDVHACLPASSYTEKGTGAAKEPHIVQLQDLLAADERNEVVRGYVHTIWPSSKSNNVEVSSATYKLFTTVVNPLFDLSLTPTQTYALSDEQVQTIRATMGTAADYVLSSKCTGNTVTDIYGAYVDIRNWMRKNGHYYDQARLRRADSVRSST